MQTMAAQEEPGLIGEAEYTTLEQTLMESDRGRRFLSEFLKRNKTPETQEILTAIHRLEKSMSRQQRRVPDLNKIRLDIADMHEAIERTKLEIANIKSEGEETNRFIDASHELDAIVTQTEGATQSILEAAEQIQEKAWVLREKGADDATCDDIDAKATEIFMACSFQDLTGQRTNKVVQVLRYLESRINLMINIWGIDDVEVDDTAGPVDTRPDAHLLNGPQRDGHGVSQSSVDELMAASATAPAADMAGETVENADIDAIMAADEGADGSVHMDAASIDDMFASAASSAEHEVGEDSDDEPEMLDEDAIARLFDAETSDVEAEAEADADLEWEETEEKITAGDLEDPLAELSESERQALFN